MPDQFEKGSKVELIEPVMTVVISNTHHTEVMLSDGSKVLLKTSQLQAVEETLNDLQ